MADRISLAELKPLVAEAAERFGVPENRIWTVIKAENSGSASDAANLREVSTTAVSPKNARGIMQMTPIALKDVTDSGLIPPGLNHENLSVRDQILTGTAYLSRLQTYSDKDDEIYAMYNYGPKARFRMDALPDETTGYLQKTGSSSPPSKQGSMMDINSMVNALLQTATTQGKAMQQGAQQMQGLQEQSAAAATKSIADQTQVIGEAAVLAGKKAQTTYQQNKLKEDLQRLLGMNAEDLNNEIGKSVADMSSAQQAYEPARAKFDQASSIDPLSNPIDYIFAQLQLPQLASQVNSLADKRDRAVQNIQQRTALLSNLNATVTANTADQIREQQLEGARIAADEATAKLSLEEAKNLAGQAQAKMQQISIANAMGDNTRQTLLGIIQIQSAEEQRQYLREQKALVNEDKAEAKAQEAIMDQRLALLSSALGMVEPMTQKRFKSMPVKEREEWQQNALNAHFGSSLLPSLEFFSTKHNPTGLNATGGSSSINIARKLKEAGAKYQSQAERQNLAASALGGKKLNAVQLREAGYDMYTTDIVNSMASVTSTEDLSSSRWDTVYNPYVGQWIGFNQVIDTTDKFNALKTNLVATTVRDLAKTGVIKGEDFSADQRKQVLEAIAAKVQRRDVTPKKAAADIAAYFVGLATYNAEVNKYSLFSLPLQSSYVFTIPGEFGSDSAKKVDLLQPGLIENALTWRANQKPFPKIQEVLKHLPISPQSLELPGLPVQIMRKLNQGDQE